MSTIRHYFDGAAPAVSPAFAATWGQGNSIRGTLQTATPTTNVAAMQHTETGSAPVWVRLGQFVGPANLTARTLTGTAAAMMHKSYTTFGTGTVATARIIVRVVSGDGLTVRGTLVTLAGTSLIQNSSNRNNKLLPSTALTPVVAQAGDRLVVEVGHFANNTSGTADTHISTLTADASLPTDLAATDATTTDGRSWLDLILDDPPNPPTGLTQTGQTSTTVTVGWTAPAAGPAPTSYEVRVDGGAPVNVGLVTSRTITGLSAGSTYAVEVRSVNSVGASAWAGPVSASTLGPPNPPTGLTQTGQTATTATVGWTAPAAGPAPTSYEVRVDGGAPVDVGLVTSTVLADLLPSSTHTVEVRAVGTAGASAWAGPLTVSTDPPADYRPWLVSETLLALAGADPSEDQPAFQWHTYAAGDPEWSVDDLRSRALIGWQITTGRQGPRDRVSPAVVTLQLAAWGDYAAAGLPELGHRFRLALSPLLTALGIDEADLPRFTGEVTDVSLDTKRRVLTVTGVGRYARAARLTVDGTGWPIEREGARVARILDAIGADVGTLDPGRVDLLPHPSPAAATQLVDVVSDSTTGQLVERRDGALDWHDADHRRDLDALLSLDAAELLAGFTWAQRVGDLTNTVAVRYAAGAEGIVDDVASVTARGPYPASIDTLLTNRAAAQAIAGLIVGRYGEPVWLLPAVLLDLTRTLALADLGTGVALAHGHKLQLTGLPAGGPYTDRGVFVEGVTETLTPRAWRLGLTVADEQLAGAPIRWRDVPDAVTWADVTPGLRWLDVATIQDPADLT